MKIYVVTHKPCALSLPKGYEYIQVNAQNNPHFCSITDDTGDHISEKNPCFCELTALYWIWKNDRENEIVGLAHYRRFFTENRFSSSPKAYLRASKIKSLLERYDFIATKRYHTKCTVKEHLLRSVRPRDYALLCRSVQKCAPEYLKAFEKVFSGHESYLLNMLISKKPFFQKYCEWLFPILFDLEQSVDMTGYSAQEKRLYGFLAERLFTVYVEKTGAKGKSFPTTIVGESKWNIAKQKLMKLLGRSVRE